MQPEPASGVENTRGTQVGASRSTPSPWSSARSAADAVNATLVTGMAGFLASVVLVDGAASLVGAGALGVGGDTVRAAPDCR